MDEEVSESSEEEGGGGWIMTFADLMSLLMCFFVLLLSFSEMDVLKFKRLAGSMSQAFGVQQKFRADDPPKGTSIIAQEFLFKFNARRRRTNWRFIRGGAS